jgi:ketosteroid isomerase-like protein
MADTGWIHEMVAVWDSHDGTKAAEYLAEDGYWQDVTSTGWRSLDRAAFADAWSVALPEMSADAHFEVERVVSDDTVFAFEWRWSGTHNASGKKYDIHAASVGQRRDGLIVAATDYWNPAHLGEQLGSEAD